MTSLFELTERRRHILTGAVSLLLVFSFITVGIKAAFGAYRGGYKIVGEFEAAGQGLIPGSDVKIRGVNVGQVKNVELVGRKALVTMRIEDGEDIPTTAAAVIRPKTLFGAKFVDIDPGEGEGKGPYLEAGDRIERTLGGFELERVLADAFPLLEAIEPDELLTVVTELANAADDVGPSINRQIINSERLTDISARHDADTRQFLHDLALLAEELGGSADDLVAGARDLNVALPTINERGPELRTLLEQAARLSGDLADVLDANRAFLRKNVVQGGKTIELLYEHRTDVVPLVVGLRRYVQTLSQAIRIEVGDGTLMAAVKGLLGGDSCAVLPCPGVGGTAAASSPANAPIDPAAPISGAEGLRTLIGGLLGISG